MLFEHQQALDDSSLVEYALNLSHQHASILGAFCVIALEHPEKWLGREVDLAGDELTMLQVAQTFSRVIGRQVDYIRCRGISSSKPWAKKSRL